FTDIANLIIGTVDGVTGLTTNNGAINLTANDLDIQQAVNAGTATVTLQPFTAGRAIDLGTNTAGQLGLTNAELNRVTAGVLAVGNASAGVITVSGAISPANSATLTLVNAGAVAGSGTVTVANLRISSGGPVTLTGANDVTNLAAALSGNGAGFSFTDANSFTVGTVDGVAGITTAHGAVTLTATAPRATPTA